MHTTSSLLVVVYKQGRSIGRFETRDINMQGAVIEMPTTNLEPNDIMDLIFLVPDGER